MPRRRDPTPQAGQRPPDTARNAPAFDVQSRRATAWTALLLVALTFAIFGNALRNPFLIDDTVIIQQDPRVTDCRITDLATGNYWSPPRGDVLYRPLVKVSYAINWAVSRQAWAFRLPNLILYAATAFVLFLLARDLFRSMRIALFASVVFALHPIHTEVLNAIVGRADIAAAFLGLLGVWVFVRYRRIPSEPGALAGLGGAALLLAAFLCKESALPLVVLVPMIDWLHRRRETEKPDRDWFCRRILRCYVPILGVVLVYLMIRFAALGAIARSPQEIGLTDNVIAHVDEVLGSGESRWLARWGTPVATFTRSVRLLVWPHPLSWDYSYAAIQPVRHWSDPRLIAGLGLLAAILVAGGVSLHRRARVFLALAFWLLPYLLVSNTIVLIGAAFAERLLYLPSAGFCLLVGMGIEAAASRIRRPGASMSRLGAGVALGAVSAALLMFAGLSIERNRDWRSRERLDRTDLETHPRSVRLLCSVAEAELHSGDLDIALAHANQAISITADYPTAWSVRGIVQARRGNTDQALVELRKALALGSGANEDVVLVMANLLADRGQYLQSIELLKQHVENYPKATAALNNLAMQLINAKPAELRDPEAARRYAKAAMAQRPSEWAIVDTYADVLAALGENDQAVAALQRLLDQMPQNDIHRGDVLTKIDALRRR